MRTRDNAGRGVGILFLLGFFGAFAMAFTKPLINAPDYFVQISGNEIRFLFGIFCLLIMGFACAGIGMLLYPTLQKFSIRLAIVVLGFRIIEGILEIISACLLVQLLPLSQQAVEAGNVDLSYFGILGSLLMEAVDWINNIYLLPWCIGAIMYYYIFYKTKLIPTWLSIWGLVGIFLCSISSVLVIFHLISPFGSIQVAMNAVIGLQEFVMALWLIVKGFQITKI